jgi:hypothetical protein
MLPEGASGPKWRRRICPGDATEPCLQLVAVRLDVRRIVVVGLVGRRVVREQLVAMSLDIGLAVRCVRNFFSLVSHRAPP